MENEFETVKESAKRVRTSEAQFYNWIREGTLKSPVVTKIGRKILVNPRELENWLKNGGSMQRAA